MAQALNLPQADTTKDGALVAAISPGSPAFRAGLQPGDVITGVNGETVTNPSDLAADIANVQPGADTSITYLRGGQSHKLSVAVATMPANPDADFQQGGGPSQSTPVESPGKLGLTLAPLTDGARSQMGLPAGTNGAVIAGVKPNSPADQAGLQPGDLVIGVGTQAVSSPDQAVAAVRAAERAGKSALALQIIRQGQSLFVGIALGKGS